MPAAAEQRGDEGAAMYFYYTNRGARLYLAPGAIPPAPPPHSRLPTNSTAYSQFIICHKITIISVLTVICISATTEIVVLLTTLHNVAL